MEIWQWNLFQPMGSAIQCAVDFNFFCCDHLHGVVSPRNGSATIASTVSPRNGSAASAGTVSPRNGSATSESSVYNALEHNNNKKWLLFNNVHCNYYVLLRMLSTTLQLYTFALSLNIYLSHNIPEQLAGTGTRIFGPVLNLNSNYKSQRYFCCCCRSNTY